MLLSHVTSSRAGSAEVIIPNQPGSVSGGIPCSSHYPPPGLSSVPELINDGAFPTRLSFCVAMSSSKSLSRKHLSLEIQQNGIEMAPCTKCQHAKVKPGETRPKCIVGPQSGKCSECVRKGYPNCDVTLSAPQWTKLRDARDALRRDIEKIEEEEIELLQKLTARRMKKVRLRKQLRLSENRTDTAVAQELEDLENAEAIERAFLPQDEEFGIEIPDQPFAFGGILEMPTESWEELWQPEAASSGGTPQLASGS